MWYAYLVFFFEYTFAFKRKSSQKLTDLPGVREQFPFPLLRKKTAGDTRSAIRLPFSASTQPKFIHCLDSLTNYSRCMSNLILLASVQAVRSWNILRFPGLNYYPRRDFAQKAKSRGGPPVTRAYIKESTHSWNIQSYSQYRKNLDCLNRGREESVGNDDVCIVCARKYEMVRMT